MAFCLRTIPSGSSFLSFSTPSQCIILSVCGSLFGRDTDKGQSEVMKKWMRRGLGVGELFDPVEKHRDGEGNLKRETEGLPF